MSNFQSVAGLVQASEDHNGRSRLVVTPLQGSSKPFFIYDTPGDVEKKIMAMPVGTLTFLRPYGAVLNQTFSWTQGLSGFDPATPEELKALKSEPAPLVPVEPVAQETEAEVAARIAAAREARRAARDAKVAAATSAPVTAI